MTLSCKGLLISIWLMTLSVTLISMPAIATDISPRCAAAVDRAAGRYSDCLLRAEAHFVRRGNSTRFDRRQMHCSERFDRQVARARKVHHGQDACPSTNRVSAIATSTAAHASYVGAEASGMAAAEPPFVHFAAGAELTSSALVLTGVNETTTNSSNKAGPTAGQMGTAEFVQSLNDESDPIFGGIPPSGNLVCNVDGAETSEFVTLSDPQLDGSTLTYSVSNNPSEPVVTPVACDGPAHVFIAGSGGPAPSTAKGQFWLPPWGTNPSTSCKDCSPPAYEHTEIGICFGGSSETTDPNSTYCYAPAGTVYKQTAAAASTVYFSIGGGNPVPNQLWKAAYLTEFNDKMNSGDLSQYNGVFYDVEVIDDATYEDFKQSFNTAKMNGFNVMVGVSYTAPYDSTCVPACAAKFPVDTDNIWKQILADPNVDIFSPQFYLGGSKALIIQTSGSSIDFKTWEDTVRDGAQIIPSLKVHGDSLAAQVQQMNDFCAGGHPRFCESGGYILWSSN